MKVVLGKRGGEATKRRRLWHSRATARVSSEKTGQNSALCATINVNPERSSERRSLFVRSPRINPNSRLPPCVLHSNPSLLNGGTIHCALGTTSRFNCAPRLASRFPNCLETWGRVFCIFESGVWHARRGGKSAARLLGGRGSCASSRAQSSASSSGKKEKRREERKSSARGRVLFFPFYD